MIDTTIFDNYASEIGQGQAVVQDQVRTGINSPMQDEYDDLLISNIELTTDVESDDNYCLMFVRKKKETFLTLNDRAKQELNQVTSDPFRLEASLVMRPHSLISTLLERGITALTGTGICRRAHSLGVLATCCSERYSFLNLVTHSQLLCEIIHHVLRRCHVLRTQGHLQPLRTLRQRHPR